VLFRSRRTANFKLAVSGLLPHLKTDVRVTRKFSKDARSTVVMQGLVQISVEEPAQPGTVTVTRNKDSKIAKKIAAAGVGAVVATDDSRVARKASRAAPTAAVGAIQGVGDDPALQKKVSQSHFVQNDLFVNEEDEQEINPDDYFNQQVRSMKQDKEKKGEDGKEKKDGAAAVPKLPGAFSVKGSKTGGWFTGGFIQRARGMGRAHSGLVVDTGIPTVSRELIPEEKTFWKSIDKTALYAGGCLLVVVLLGVSIPLALVKSAPPPPTMAPTSPRMPLYDSFRSAIANITGYQALENPDSAQSQSLNWLVYEDELFLDLHDPTLMQRFILMTMYFENHGKSWIYRDGVKWGSGVSECDWDYVVCDVTNAVSNLTLHKVGMVGTLVRELSMLSRLLEFDVSENALSEDVFPTILTQMISLEKLDIHGTAMSGVLPDAIGDLSNLRQINFDDNSFIGSLPKTMKNLTSLVEALFASNQFSGPILDTALNWPKLSSLDAGNNLFTGTIPIEISRSSMLKSFTLANNKFSGPLPSELGMLTEMTTFSWGMGVRGSAGSIPNELGNWKKLSEFAAFSAGLIGTIPTSFGKCVELSFMTLDGNSLQGSIPSEFGLLTMLTNLLLSNNAGLNDTIPSELGLLTVLASLELQGTGVSGSMPSAICNLRNTDLMSLQADCGGITAQIKCLYPECCTNCNYS